MNFSKKTIGFLLAGIVLLAFFLRAYHFEEHLLFRIDQERDYQIIKKAFNNGFKKLPLLGPRAGDPIHLDLDLPNESSSLNLGPIYYYFQYLATLVFNSSAPWVLAVPDLFFSILAIPLFYFILRFNFSRWVSFLSTLILAFSFPLVEYSRFAWNTNQIIFWQLLLFLALLKVCLVKKEKFRKGFFLLIFLSLGVITQLHFIAFFVFPALILIFWLFFGFPKKIGYRYWLLGIALFLFVYSPLIISDIVNHGENFQRLIVAYVQEGADLEKKISFGKKIEKIFLHTGQMVSHSLFSLNSHEVDKIEIISAGFFWTGILMLSFSFLRKKENNKKIDQKTFVRGLFLIFIGLIFLVYWKIFHRLHNFRYWIFLVPVFFWLLAESLGFLENKLSKKVFFWLSSFLIFFILTIQLTAVVDFYYGLEKGKNEQFFGRELFLDDYQDLISFKMLKETAQKVILKSDNDGHQVCFWVEPYQQKNSFKMLLKEIYGEKQFFEKIVGKNKSCSFFLITEMRKKGVVFPNKAIKDFQPKSFSVIGSIVLWEVIPLEERENYVIIDKLENLFEEDLAKKNEENLRKFLTWENLWKK